MVGLTKVGRTKPCPPFHAPLRSMGIQQWEIHRMTGKTASKGAAKVVADDIVHARQGDEGRMTRARGGAARWALPTMHASARRRGPRVHDVAGAPRKPKRAKRTPGLGGRLAAAIRMARLRAGRAAEEFGARR